MPSWEDEPFAELAKRPLTKDEFKALNQFNWDDLAGFPFKYLEHIPFARMEGALLVAPPRPSPYANIIVQDLVTSDRGLIQIAHKMDFYNLWLLEVQGALKGEFDVIIRHKRPDGIKRMFASVLPHLEYSVYTEDILTTLRTNPKSQSSWKMYRIFYLYDQHRPAATINSTLSMTYSDILYLFAANLSCKLADDFSRFHPV